MNVRREALNAFMDIAYRGAYANLRMKTLSSVLPDSQAKWASALVYTALDHRLTSEYYLSSYVRDHCKPVIRAILCLGATELLFFSTSDHAAVSEYVNLTKSVGKAPLAAFVNAVLRALARDNEAGSLPPLPTEPKQRLSVQFSYPLWLVSEWVDTYGEAFTQQLLSSPQAKPTIRAQFPYTTEELCKSLSVPSERGIYDPNALVLENGTDFTALPEFTDGRMTIQSESAMLVCRALGDVSGKAVLDACAAPGGKSAYLASLTENTVRLTCMELHEHRVELIRRTFERLHVAAEIVHADAAVLNGAYCGRFDAVLVDAPCSGLGLTHDKPDIRYAKSDADIVSLCEIQKSILSACAEYVKPNGVLVYATCTISKRENEDCVRSFLASHSDFALEALPIPICNDGTVQLFPHIHGLDGFFIARMRRSERSAGCI